MTLSEKIVRQLRQHKDGGLSTEMLASALQISSSKVAEAVNALMEQEHVILGSDNCWYLGDALLGRVVYVAEQAEQPAEESTPVDAPEPEYTAVDGSEYAARAPEDDNGSYFYAPKAREPSIRSRMIEWALSQPEDAEPISWRALSAKLNVTRKAMGKARAAMVKEGQTEELALLDRLAVRTHSTAPGKAKNPSGQIEPKETMRNVNPEQVTVTKSKPFHWRKHGEPADSVSEPEHTGTVIVLDERDSLQEDIRELASKLSQPAPLPAPVLPNWRKNRDVLLEIDFILSNCMKWPETRAVRTALQEVCAWLEEAGKAGDAQ